VCRDDKNKRERRQERPVKQFAETHVAAEARDCREVLGFHGEVEDQNVAEEKLGGADGCQSDDVGDTVKDRVAKQRNDDTEYDRYRNRDHGRVGRQKQRVDEAVADRLAHPFPGYE